MSWKQTFLDAAEVVDAWRILPRVISVGYAYVFWRVVDWYMNLKSYLPDEFKSLIEKVNSPEQIQALSNLMIQEPTTTHTVLVTTVVGVASIIVGLYINSKRKWKEDSERSISQKQDPLI